MVSTAVRVFLVIAIVFSFALPIGAVVYWRRTRKDVRWRPILVGALTFVLLALVLEPLLHQICLVADNPISRAINGNPYLYMLYGGLAAGIFEETGRYLAFRFPLRRDLERDTAVSYGIGHGGIEVILVYGAAMISLLVLAVAPQALADVPGGADTAVQLGALSVGGVLLGMFERVMAMLFHIALSIFVFVAARDRTQRSYFPFAVALHAIADMPAALYQKGVLPMAAVEIWMAVVTLYALRSARKLFLEETDP